MTDGEIIAHLGRRCAGIIQEDSARIEELEAVQRGMERQLVETLDENKALRDLLEKSVAHLDFLAKILRETKSLKPLGGKSQPTWKVAADEAEAGAKKIREAIPQLQAAE